MNVLSHMPKIGIVSTTVDSASYLSFFIEYHTAIGIDRIYLFFDDPEDEGIQIARHYSNVECHVRSKSIEDKWKITELSQDISKYSLRNSEVMVRQELNTELAIEYARNAKLNWIIHIDTDELLYPNGNNIKEYFHALDERKLDNVTFLNYEAAPTSCNFTDPFTQVETFRVNTFYKIKKATKKSIEHPFLFYQNGKSAAKISDVLKPDGVHFFESQKPAEIASHKAPIILHYHCSTFHLFTEKYKRLGYFDDNWQGKPRTGKYISNFHIKARNAHATGNKDALFKLFQNNIIISAEKVKYLLKKKELVRIKNISNLHKNYNPSVHINEKHSIETHLEFFNKKIQKIALKDNLSSECQQTFIHRFTSIANQFVKLTCEVYKNEEERTNLLKGVVNCCINSYKNRSKSLLDFDKKRLANPNWINSNEVVAATCYLDLFCGNILNLRKRIGYLREHGINYLYLLPIFDCPDGENDGGFAVSNYKKIHPSLGSIDQLEEATELLRENGISLSLDFILNHTSDEHPWALKAKAGQSKYRDYYLFIKDKKDVDEYLEKVVDAFPEQGRDITYNEELKSYIWTTFNRFQWDLNFRNPEVFTGMLDNLLFLANKGVEIFRIDAAPHIWKEKGTNCSGLPESFKLMKMYNLLLRVVAPSCQMKSEAMVAPDKVKRFVSRDRCTLAYRPLLTGLLWQSVANADTSLMADQLTRWSALPNGCNWVNYVNCHDDLHWLFHNKSISRLRPKQDIQEFYNKLMSFYGNSNTKSFAKGLVFQGQRVSGTTASLAGLERALEKKDLQGVTKSISRILLMYSVVLSIGGIPMLYLGDEIAELNDYSYQKEPNKCNDTRWVHRIKRNWFQSQMDLANIYSIPSRINSELKRMIQLRKSIPALSGNQFRIIGREHSSILTYVRESQGQRFIFMGNFTPFNSKLTSQMIIKHNLAGNYKDLISNRLQILKADLELAPYEYLWLISNEKALNTN